MQAKLLSARVRNFQAVSLDLLSEKTPQLSFHYKHSYRTPTDPSDYTVMVVSHVETVDPSDSGFSFALDLDTIFEYEEPPADIKLFIQDACLQQVNNLCTRYFIALLKAIGIESRPSE